MDSTDSNMEIRNEKVDSSLLVNFYEGYKTNYIWELSLKNGENKLTIEVKYRLSIDEAIAVVDSVCNGVVNPKTGEYHPELKDYFLRIAVLRAYTNLVLPEGNLCWDLVYGTPIFTKVVGSDHNIDCMISNIDIDQYNQIVDAIDRKIESTIKHKLVAEIVYGVANAISDLVCAGSIERGSEFHAP